MVPKFVLRFCVVLAALFFAQTSTQAQTTIHVPADQPTIQAGINAANGGDTVLVAPGVYNESIDFKGKAITVTSSAGAATTIIDAGAIHEPVANFTNGEPRTAVLNGFTLRNGGSGGTLSGKTGGVYISASSPTISNNVVTQNHCYGIESLYGSPLLQGNEVDNTIDNNDACGFAAGAAIWLSGSVNYYNGGTSPLGPPAIVLGNTLQNNTQSGREDAGGNGGVGVAVWGANALIEANIVRNNVTLGEGAILAFNTDLVSVIGNLVYGNTATDVAAGIDVKPPQSTVGPFVGVVANNTVAGNIIAGVSGYGPLTPYPASQVFLSGDLAQYALINNLIIDNSSLPALSCDTNYNSLSITPVVLDHNDIFNPGGGPAYGGSCPDQTGTYGNISADPLFANASTGDFHLQSGSPAIDTGNNSAPMMLPTDIAGSARIQDATRLGYPVVDMGAYEAMGAPDTQATVLTLTPSTYYGIFTEFGPPPGPFTLTATLSAGSSIPAGPVTFYEDLKSIGTVNVDATGTATLQPKVAPGLHAFVATYPGQGQYTPAVSVKFYVLFPKASPALTLTSTPNPSVFPSSVTFTVAAASSDGITPSPVSLVDTSSNTTLVVLSPDSSGQASFTISTLAVGSHNITASFAGSATDNAASASVTQVVVSAPPSTTTLTSSLNPSTYLQPVTFTAHVASSSPGAAAPTGTLTFLDGNTTLATLPLDTAGSASFTTAALTALAVAHVITAQFTPTGNFAPSSAQVNQLVNGLATTTNLAVTPLAGASTDTYTMVATVTNSSGTATTLTPTGTVNFYFNGYGTSANYANVVNGIATFHATDLNPGQNIVTAAYHGDTAFAASSSSPVVLTINGVSTTLTLTSSANPAAANSSFMITAHLTANGAPAPAGTVIQLTLGPVANATLVTDATGTASTIFTIGTPGTYPITATFAGQNNLLPSTASLSQVVVGYTTATSLFSSPNPAYQGQTVTLSATVALSSSTPPSALTGSVNFYDGTTLLGTVPLKAGAATFSTSALSLGTHSLSAAFPTTGSITGSTSSVVQQIILPSTFAVALSPSTITLSAGKSGTVAVNLSSIGAFAGPLTLSAGPLPTYATGSFTPATVTLSPAGTASANLVLTTAQEAANHLPSHPGNKSTPLILAAFLILPLSLTRSRRLLRQALALAAIAVLTQTLTGCGEIAIPYHLVPAGTYQVPVTATDSNNIQHSATLTVVIAP